MLRALALHGEEPVSNNLSSSIQNLILAQLSPDDLALIEPHLEAVDLPLRRRLEARNKPISHIYFLEQGIASVVANGPTDRSIEVGIIGRDGMTGLPVVMGTERSPHETFIQTAGNGRRITADAFRSSLEKSASLRQHCLNYVHVFMIQAAHTALANGRAKLDERLARWLLMAEDRADNGALFLTHEFLALMLGVRRPGVTVALNMLEEEGLIQAKRGAIFIVDRKGLLEKTNGFYGGPEAEARRLARR
jgi:CRP-like cAMP-binding protein